MTFILYFFKVLEHKWWVLIAGLKVTGIPLYRLLIHDWTKFTPSEFPQYARKYCGGYHPKSLLESPLGYTGKLKHEVDREYAKAWEHHYKHPSNRHHWNSYVDESGNPQEMPEEYIRECVADWYGASRGYTGSWVLTSWLQDNLPKINLHTNTRIRLYELLREFGYETYDEPGNKLVVKKHGVP